MKEHPQKTKPAPVRRSAGPKSVRLPSTHETSEGLSLQVPAGFELSEATMVLKAPDKQIHDPRMLHKQTFIRPNLLVKRTTRSDQTLIELAADLSEHLIKNIPGITPLDAGPFKFADGVEGYKSSYEFQPMPKVRLKQFHVLRIDAEGAIHFTLTVGVDAQPAQIEQYLACIAATRLDH